MLILRAIMDGILLGGVYGVISTGLSLVFGVLGLVNFAHAEFMMLGMYVAWLLWRLFGIDPILGALGSGLLIAALGYIIERGLIQRVLKAPPSAQISLTVGLMISLENAALVVFGNEFRSVSVPLYEMSLNLGAISIGMGQALAFVAAMVVSGALWLFLGRTWTGRAIRATAQDSMAATITGVNVKRIYAMTFAIGVGLSAMGGGIILPSISASPTVGTQFAVLMFTVVVLGGLGNVTGALVGGLVVGVIQSVSAAFMPVSLQNLVLFLVFIAVLSLRPQGLLKQG